MSARDVVDELPTTVPASQSPARMMHKNLWYKKLLERYGLRAHRVGEASRGHGNRFEGDHTGPSSHRVRRVPDEHDEVCRGTGSRRRRRRLRPLPWSRESDTESDGPELTHQARRSEEVFVHSDRGRQVEHDLVGNPEVPATEVGPTALGFSPEDGFGRPASGRTHDPETMRVDVRSDEGPGPILLRRGRFAALADDDTEEATQEIPARQRRRLRILWQEPAEVERVTCAPTQIEPDSHEEHLARVCAHNASNCESDSGRSGASEADGDPESQDEVLVEPVNVNMRARAVTSGFESLDIVELTDVFQFKASIMQSVPKFLHGAYRSALRQAIDGVKSGLERNDVALQVRAWKLFLLVPRMLLFRPCRGGTIPRKTIEERVALFQSGHWDVLVEMSLDASMQAGHGSIQAQEKGLGQCGEARSTSSPIGAVGRGVCRKTSLGRCFSRSWHQRDFKSAPRSRPPTKVHPRASSRRDRKFRAGGGILIGSGLVQFQFEEGQAGSGCWSFRHECGPPSPDVGEQCRLLGPLPVGVILVQRQSAERDSGCDGSRSDHCVGEARRGYQRHCCG